MSSVLKVEGQPLVRFVFDYIPSWNEEVKKARTHRFVGHGSTKTWRIKGYKLAKRFMEEMHPHKAQLIEKRALVVVKVFRATERKYDVHNVCMKALMDGFSDANLWPDDEWVFVPVVIFMWAPMEPREVSEQRFEVEIHELGALHMDGRAQLLPEGRGGNRSRVRG